MEINKYYNNKSKKSKGCTSGSNNRYHRNYGYDRFDRNNDPSPNNQFNNSDNRNNRDNRDFRNNRD